MKLLKQAIHTALRDDSVATIGMRTLLAHAATPWGVYEAFLPEQPDFSSRTYLTWKIISGSAVCAPLSDAYLREAVFEITVWGSDMDKVDDALVRARSVLENLRRVTLPTSGIALHSLKWEGNGPDRFDPDYQVYSRSEQYRAFYREDVTA